MKFSFTLLILLLTLTIQCFASPVENQEEMIMDLGSNATTTKAPCKKTGESCTPGAHECCDGGFRCIFWNKQCI